MLRYSVAFEATYFETASGETSDKIDIVEGKLQFQNNYHDLFWPYRSQIELNSWGFEYLFKTIEGLNVDSTINELNGNYQFLLNESSKLILYTGIYRMNNKLNSNKNMKIRIGGQYQLLWERLTLDLKVIKENAHHRLLLLNNDLKDLDADHISLVISNKLFNNKIHLKGLLHHDILHQSNSRSNIDLEAMYAFMVFPHWIRGGFGYQNLNFKKNINSYWSPDKFYSFGPRIDLSIDLKYINFITGGNYVWFEEDGIFSGNGYYLRSGISLGDREFQQFKFFFEKNESVSLLNI